jgi:hypothetical protein
MQCVVCGNRKRSAVGERCRQCANRVHAETIRLARNVVETLALAAMEHARSTESPPGSQLQDALAAVRLALGWRAASPPAGRSPAPTIAEVAAMVPDWQAMPNTWADTCFACPECPAYLIQTLDGRHWTCVTRADHGVYVIRAGLRRRVPVVLPDPPFASLA